MIEQDRSDALSMLSSTLDESHDGLAAFSAKLKALEDVPSFWCGAYPVWIEAAPEVSGAPWPILSRRGDMVAIAGLDRKAAFRVSQGALLAGPDGSEEALAPGLSPAEMALFLDLAEGLSLEESASRSGVTTATRRKQLQGVFRKLDVQSQPALVNLANHRVQILRQALEAYTTDTGGTWREYLPFLPEGVRYGVLGGGGPHPVRYLDIGPVGGRPVLVAHPMIFPHLDGDDVALFHELGWRTIWPIWPGCLTLQNSKAGGWDDHAEAAARDLAAVRQMFADHPVPVIALVSSGAYATRLAMQAPDAVSRLDFVSTCFSAGNRKSRDVYFGDFLLRHLKANGRMAMLAIRHLSAGVLEKDQMEKTLRRIFRGSAPDLALLTAEFGDPVRAERLRFAILNSIDSMRFDYLSQLNFTWRSVRDAAAPVTFWHGREDRVHCLDDLKELSRSIVGKEAKVIPDMGHLTQGAPLHAAFRRLAADYLK